MMFADPLADTAEHASNIGHNAPPSAIDDARSAYDALAKFLASKPVISDEADAREAKLYLDRTKATLKDVEAAKESEAKPLHAAWKASLDKFKPASESLTKLLGELNDRLTVFARAEKAKREAIARELAAKAAEAERLAREAEAKELEAKENASMGDCEADVGAAIEQADTAFASFEKASRFADRAERDTKVRLGGGFGRAVSLRTVKTLVLDDAAKALAAIGSDEGVTAALLTAARAYRKTHGVLPAGVSELTEEKI